MSVRTWFNDNPGISLMVVAVLLIGSLGVLAMQMRGTPAEVDEVYFWDLGTEEAFAGPTGAIPPIEAPSGDEGVHAHLLTCGECTPDQWFGYLEKYSDSAKRMYEEQEDLPGADDDILVRALHGERWVSATSRAGEQILTRVYEQATCRDPSPCQP